MSNQNSRSLKSIIKTRENNLNKSKRASKQKISTKSESVESETTSSEEYKNVNINELIYPCKDAILQTKVMLYPHQMNNDAYINLKKNLIDKVENKCTKDGYIMKVYKIVEYKNGILEPENFTGSAVYDIKYLAKICVALKDSTIIGKISSYFPNGNFAIADFGPIIKIILTRDKRDLNTNIFSIGNDKSIIHNLTQKKIGVDDYIKIQLKTVKFFQNDTIIKCIGYLENLPTIEEIEKFAYKPDDNNKINNEPNKQKTIYFNDDNEVEENNIEKSLINQKTEEVNIEKKNNFSEI